MTDTRNEFILTVVVRKRDDLEHPTDSGEAIRMARQLLEQGSFLDVVSVVGRRRFVDLPEPTDGQTDLAIPDNAPARPESL